MIKTYVDMDKLTLAEIAQQKKIRMALVRPEDSDWQQLHKPFLCRDFFTEVILENYSPGSALPYPKDIYGFQYDVLNYPVPEGNVYIQFIFPKGLKDIFKRNIIHLKILEDKGGYQLTEIIYDCKDSLILLVDRKWFSYTYYFSLYTLLLKCLVYEVDGKGEDFFNNIVTLKCITNEKDYIKDILKHTSILKFMKDYDKINAGVQWPIGLGEEEELPADVYEIHHHSGIVSFFGKNSLANSNWKRTKK